MFDGFPEMDLLVHKENFQNRLATWYHTAQRPLPWRTNPSLYRTVVSELMAQQTQIKTMLPYFERWMERFPNFQALADATEADVLKYWEGLGYYSRARNLHKLAKAYLAADQKPSTREAWQALPGIGPYTSAAIASISFKKPVAVVDGNVVRILARLTHDTRRFKSNGEAVKTFTDLANKIINHENPGNHNQAMMELGATVCLKHRPHCTLCPVRQFCRSCTQSEIETIPRIERKATEKLEIARAWILHKERILLQRIPSYAGQLAGQYELPKLADLDINSSDKKPFTIKSRSITHRRIKEPIYMITPSEKLLILVKSQATLFWISLKKLDRVTLSGPHRRWINELLDKTNAET